MIAAVVACQFFGVVDFITHIRFHLSESLMWVGAYLAVGIVWSFIKWFSFLIQYRDKYQESRAAFLAADKPKDGTTDVERWREWCSSRGYGYSRRYGVDTVFYGQSILHKPQATENKSRIIAWMSFWPFSLVGTVLNDPVRRLFNWLYSSLKAQYQRMADWALKGIPNDE